MDYANRFNALTESLKAAPGIEVQEHEFYLKASASLAILGKHPGLRPLEAELRVLNDNVLQWSFADAGLPGGEFHFYAIEQALALPPVGNDLLIFDDHPAAGDGLMGCIKLQGNDYELWLYNAGGQEFQLQLDLPGYFEKLTDLKAVFGWQYLFIKQGLNKADVAAEKAALKRRLALLGKAFPKEDFSNYLKQLS